MTFVPKSAAQSGRHLWSWLLAESKPREGLGRALRKSASFLYVSVPHTPVSPAPAPSPGLCGEKPLVFHGR